MPRNIRISDQGICHQDSPRNIFYNWSNRLPGLPRSRQSHYPARPSAWLPVLFFSRYRSARSCNNVLIICVTVSPVVCWINCKFFSLCSSNLALILMASPLVWLVIRTITINYLTIQRIGKRANRRELPPSPAGEGLLYFALNSYKLVKIHG